MTPARGASRSRRGELAALAALLAALAALLALSPLAWRADRLWQDLMVASLSRPPPDDTLIVAIDDESVAAIGRWPWPRAVLATLLRGMAAAAPRSITLDLLLSESDATADPWLAAEIKATTARGVPVLMPVTWQASVNGIDVLWPTEALRPALKLGAAESAVDVDGVLRHLFLQAGPPGTPFPHLALSVLEASGGQLHPSLKPIWNPAPEAGRWQRDGLLVMRFAGPPGTVPRVSALEVLQGRVDASRLAGRDLLFGLTAQGLGDTLATPVNAGHRAMPGVEVLAHGLAMLRHGGSPRTVSPGVLAIGSALFLVVLLGLMERFGERRALALALGALPLGLAASAVSAQAGWLWSPLPLVLPALLAYPLWSWLRLRWALGLLAREIRTLASAQTHARPEADSPASPDKAVMDFDRQLQALEHASLHLREAHRDQAALLEGLPTAMLVGDANGRVHLGNAHAASLFEVETADELQGLDLARLLGELGTAETLDWRVRLAGLAPGAEGIAIEAKKAGQDWLLHARSVATAAGRRTLVSLADLAAVREAQRAREEALAFVSHDLRGPAATIVMLAELHATGHSPKPADALMPELKQLAQRTLDLADDFVLAARAGTRPLLTQPVTAAELLDDALLDLRPRALAAGVHLELPPMPASCSRRHWQLDRRLVVRALSNLLSNALRHSPRGGTLKLAAAAEGDALVLDVVDSGPGLTLAQIDDIAAARAPGTSTPGGSGFGLAFVLQVAARHRGQLQALRPEGPAPRGAWLRLWLRDATAAPAVHSGNP